MRQYELFGESASEADERIALNIASARTAGVNFDVANVRVEIPKDVDVAPEIGASTRARWCRSSRATSCR